MVLVAHGSADPRAAATTRALAGLVAAARPGRDVRTAYLDHTAPGPAEVLAAAAAAGHRAVTVVPLLLTAAYHGRVDLPAVLAAARAGGASRGSGASRAGGAGVDGGPAPVVRVTDVLGPTAGAVPGPLVAGLRRRLAEAPAGGRPAGSGARSAGSGGRLAGSGARSAPGGFDAVVLAAAGTRDPAARATVDQVAAVLGAALGVPCRAAYASAAEPTAGQAVAALRRRGARRVAMAAYFLAPGRLYEVAAGSARAAGAVAVAAPLGAAAELAQLVLVRLDATGPAADGRTTDRPAGRPAGRPAAQNAPGQRLRGVALRLGAGTSE